MKTINVQAIENAAKMSDHAPQVHPESGAVGQNLQGPYALKQNAKGYWTFDLPPINYNTQAQKYTAQALSDLTGNSLLWCQGLLEAIQNDNTNKSQGRATNSTLTYLTSSGKTYPGIGDVLGYGYRYSIESNTNYTNRISKQIDFLIHSIDDEADVLCIQEQPYDFPNGVKDSRQDLFKEIMNKKGYVQIAMKSGRDVGIWAKKTMVSKFSNIENSTLKTFLEDPNGKGSLLRGCATQTDDTLYINIHMEQCKQNEQIPILVQLKQEIARYTRRPPRKVVLQGDFNLFQLSVENQNKLKAEGYTIEPVRTQEKRYETPTFEAYIGPSIAESIAAQPAQIQAESLSYSQSHAQTAPAPQVYTQAPVSNQYRTPQSYVQNTSLIDHNNCYSLASFNLGINSENLLEAFLQSQEYEELRFGSFPAIEAVDRGIIFHKPYPQLVRNFDKYYKRFLCDYIKSYGTQNNADVFISGSQRKAENYNQDMQLPIDRSQAREQINAFVENNIAELNRYRKLRFNTQNDIWEIEGVDLRSPRGSNHSTLNFYNSLKPGEIGFKSEINKIDHLQSVLQRSIAPVASAVNRPQVTSGFIMKHPHLAPTPGEWDLINNQQAELAAEKQADRVYQMLLAEIKANPADHHIGLIYSSNKTQADILQEANNNSQRIPDNVLSGGINQALFFHKLIGKINQGIDNKVIKSNQIRILPISTIKYANSGTIPTTRADIDADLAHIQMHIDAGYAVYGVSKGDKFLIGGGVAKNFSESDHVQSQLNKMARNAPMPTHIASSVDGRFNQSTPQQQVSSGKASAVAPATTEARKKIVVDLNRNKDSEEKPYAKLNNKGVIASKVSDHEPIFVDTPYGKMCYFNIMVECYYIAPTRNTKEKKNNCFNLQEQGKTDETGRSLYEIRLEKILGVLQEIQQNKKVVGFMLQEAPPANHPQAAYFYAKLKHKLPNFNVDNAFISNTEGAKSSMFSMFDKNIFTEQTKLTGDGRHQVIKLKDKTNSEITVVNIHGDFTAQPQTADNIVKHISKDNVVIGGDLNITVNTEACSKVVKAVNAKADCEARIENGKLLHTIDVAISTVKPKPKLENIAVRDNSAKPAAITTQASSPVTRSTPLLSSMATSSSNLFKNEVKGLKPWLDKDYCGLLDRARNHGKKNTWDGLKKELISNVKQYITDNKCSSIEELKRMLPTIVKAMETHYNTSTQNSSFGYRWNKMFSDGKTRTTIEIEKFIDAQVKSQLIIK